MPVGAARRTSSTARTITGLEAVSRILTEFDVVPRGVGFQAAFGSDRWIAQTFTSPKTGIATGIRVVLRRLGLPGAVTLAITATGGDGKPSGSDLASASTDGDALSTAAAGTTLDIELDGPLTVNGGIMYALIYRALDGNVTNALRVILDDAGTYAGGEHLLTLDGGATWDPWGNVTDAYFRIYGHFVAARSLVDP